MPDSTPRSEVNPFHALLCDVRRIEALLSQVLTLALQQGSGVPLSKVVPAELEESLWQAIHRAQTALDEPRILQRRPHQQHVRLHDGLDAPSDTTLIGLFLGGGVFVLSSLEEDMEVGEFLRASRYRLGCNDIRQAIANIARRAEGECREAMQFSNSGLGGASKGETSEANQAHAAGLESSTRTAPRRGRKATNREADLEFLEAWGRYRNYGHSFEAFCKDRGKTVKEGERIKNRASKARKNMSKARK